MRIILAFVMGLTTCAVGSAADSLPASQPASSRVRVNILLITADDMNYDSLGVTGCRVPDVTPNLDRLAGEGLRFVHAHVTIAVCQPCRSVLMTGRYPYNNGAMGFEPIDTSVPTLTESLREAGYFNGIMAKVGHLAPIEKFCWDVVVRPEELGIGRDPEAYYRHAKAFFEKARTQRKPFFLMANSQDPHRPFAGSDQEAAAGKQRNVDYPDARRHYAPDEVQVPGFLPDLPEVRREVAEYYSSVHRCDQTVGEILRALRETGYEDSTLVMFLSDNGMAFPFAKTNCYLASTKTPWIVRWPGRIRSGTIDDRHLISGIDFMPTILDAVGVEAVRGMDGRSFLPLLFGQPQKDREQVYTTFHRTSGKQDYPMRCVQNRRFGYIFSPWSDARTVFLNESQSGRSFKAMQEAAELNPDIARRVTFFQYRVPEELYDLQKDPDALVNLMDDDRYADVLEELRTAMAAVMADTGDPLLETFKRQVLRRE